MCLWCCCFSCNVVYKWDPLFTLGSKFILMQVVAMPSSEWSELDRLLHLISRMRSWAPSVMLHTYLCFIIYMFAFEDTVPDMMVVKTCFQYTENETLSLIFYHTDSATNGSWMSEWDLILWKCQRTQWGGRPCISRSAFWAHKLRKIFTSMVSAGSRKSTWHLIS